MDNYIPSTLKRHSFRSQPGFYISSHNLKSLGLILCLALGLGLLPKAGAAEMAPNALTVERLRCEYLVNPLGLDVTQPRLDWILTAPGNVPRNLSQVSYHLLVASSPDLLAKDQGDLWDSGDVQSDQTDHIAYSGAPLNSREASYWKVRVTDSLGHTSGWSEPASWEMGLLQPGDWQAKWIDAPRIAQVDAAPQGNITILRASYETADGSAGKDVTSLVAGMLKDNALSVAVSNETLGGDPAPKQVKRLRVTYSVDGKNDETTADEGATLTLPATRSSLPYLRKEFTVGKTVAKRASTPPRSASTTSPQRPARRRSHLCAGLDGL